MRIVACQQEGHLQGVTTHSPLGLDLVAEVGAPFAVLFSLFEDATATNLRGLWEAWSLYEQGEVAYVTPEGPESGDTSERTPSAFGLWVALQRTQHAEPAKQESREFWTPMQGMVLSGRTVKMVLPGEEVAGIVSGSTVEARLSSVQTATQPSSVPYRLEVLEGSNVLFYAARGQIVFRQIPTP